jgi:DNA-binding CsgD family transcriptional regulator
MGLKRQSTLKKVVTTESGFPATTLVAGLVLMDRSLKLIACDRGAAAILNARNRPGVKLDVLPEVPNEILAIIRNRKPAELSAVNIPVRMGEDQYTCRAYLIESNNGFLTQPVIALHMEKISSANDAVNDIAAKYRLTERELQALRGISMGFSSKELAERMNISPNTVKVFLRLIMIKMGVTSRGEIVASMLQNRAKRDEAAILGNVSFREK